MKTIKIGNQIIAQFRSTMFRLKIMIGHMILSCLLAVQVNAQSVKTFNQSVLEVNSSNDHHQGGIRYQVGNKAMLMYYKNGNLEWSISNTASHLDLGTVRMRLNHDGNNPRLSIPPVQNSTQGALSQLCMLDYYGKGNLKLYPAEGETSIYGWVNIIAKGSEYHSEVRYGNHSIMLGTQENAGGTPLHHASILIDSREKVIIGKGYSENPSSFLCDIFHIKSDFKLAVIGSLSATGGTIKDPGLRMEQVNSIWPDYVFEESYQLPKIEEVEDFINTYKHLPGIPSQAEVETSGYSFFELYATLLKKVEELTLYTIEKEKVITALEQANKKKKDR